MIDIPEDFPDRLLRIVDDIELGMDCLVWIGQDDDNEPGRFYFQIKCWRKDAITGEMGWGYGGRAYLDERASDGQLIQTIFGLYKGYWEHEARETFKWRDRRVFGPHMDVQALWEVARRIDMPSATHVTDK